MTNLDSIIKSKNITLPTNIHLVKAMVFPVVMYGCDSWSIKKAEHQRIDAFELWCWNHQLGDVSLSKLRELVMNRRPGVLQSMGSHSVGHE